jgi:hypothetical protein
VEVLRFGGGTLHENGSPVHSLWMGSRLGGGMFLSGGKHEWRILPNGSGKRNWVALADRLAVLHWRPILFLIPNWSANSQLSMFVQMNAMLGGLICAGLPL